MKPLHIETPIIQSECFPLIAGEVFLKLENLQPTGSFKIRGIGHLCQSQYKKGARHFVCSSGGNAGLACAYSAKILGAQATVVLPNTTSTWAQQKIREQGASVKIFGKSWAEADTKTQELAQKGNAVYVPPFDHPLIFKGNSSVMHEAKRQMKKPSGIVVAVGGGGLLAGVLQGLKKIGWGRVPVYAAETKGAANGLRHAWGIVVDVSAYNTCAVCYHFLQFIY